MFPWNSCGQSVSLPFLGKKIKTRGVTVSRNEADMQSFSFSLQVDHAVFLMTSFIYSVYEINTHLFVSFLTAFLYLSILQLLPISSLSFSVWSCSSSAIHPHWHRNPVCIALLWREYMSFCITEDFCQEFFHFAFTDIQKMSQDMIKRRWKAVG